MKGNLHRLRLNNKQRTLAFKHAGTSRHAYNWGVALCNEISEKRDKLPSSIDLHKLLVKDVKPDNMWYYEASKCAPQQALRNLSTSWSNFFRKLKSGEVEKNRKSYIREQKSKGLEINNRKLNNICKPKFKKKGVNESFYIEGKIVVDGNKIKVPKFGWIRMEESYGEPFMVKNVTISLRAGFFFISFRTELGNKIVKGIDKKPSVGVDLGVKTLATMSDGKSHPNAKAHKKYKRNLKIAQRKVSKKYNKDEKVQSKNYYKAKNRVSKTHFRISCIRKDSIHKLTTQLAKNHSMIVIEDLNVKGMLKNRRLSGAIQDGGFHEFRRQLEYKTEWYGSKLVVIDRFYPSSKTCSSCSKVKKELKLSERTYKCEGCGLAIDRDLNAAINIRRLAESYDVIACGELNKPNAKANRDSLKQEENSKMLSFV